MKTRKQISVYSIADFVDESQRLADFECGRNSRCHSIYTIYILTTIRVNFRDLTPPGIREMGSRMPPGYSNSCSNIFHLESMSDDGVNIVGYCTFYDLMLKPNWLCMNELRLWFIWKNIHLHKIYNKIYSIYITQTVQLQHGIQNKFLV